MKRLTYLLILIPLFCFSQISKNKDIGINRDIGIWKSGVNYNDSAEVLFSYWTDEDATLKAATSEWYDFIQLYHIDDTCDCTYGFAVNSSANAVYDWFRYGTTATLVNSPTFTAYEGYLTDGISSYIKTNYNPETDKVHYRLNSASIAIYIRTNNYTSGKYLFGLIIAPNYLHLAIVSASLYGTINSIVSFDYAHSNNISGFIINNRNSSTTIQYARNSNIYTQLSNNVGVIPNNVNGVFIGCRNLSGNPSDYSNNQFSWVHICGQLTELQKTKLYEADERFLDSYGKGVNP